MLKKPSRVTHLVFLLIFYELFKQFGSASYLKWTKILQIIQIKIKQNLLTSPPEMDQPRIASRHHQQYRISTHRHNFNASTHRHHLTSRVHNLCHLNLRPSNNSAPTNSRVYLIDHHHQSTFRTLRLTLEPSTQQTSNDRKKNNS